MTQDFATEISKCLTYDEICLLWEKLPEVIQTRSPELTYRASEDGYNLHTTYFERLK